MDCTVLLKPCVRLDGLNGIQLWKILMTCIFPYVIALMILLAIRMVNGIASLLLEFLAVLLLNFIAAFKVNLYLFGFTKHLSTLLQGSTVNLLYAYKQIGEVKKILQAIRKNDVQEFEPVFKSMLEMADSDGMPVPRTCWRQTARSNVEALSPKDYWRITVFIPFLDHLLQEFVQGCFAGVTFSTI